MFCPDVSWDQIAWRCFVRFLPGAFPFVPAVVVFGPCLAVTIPFPMLRPCLISNELGIAVQAPVCLINRHHKKLSIGYIFPLTDLSPLATLAILEKKRRDREMTKIKLTREQ